MLHRETLFAEKGREAASEYGAERQTEITVGSDGCARYCAEVSDFVSPALRGVGDPEVVQRK